MKSRAEATVAIRAIDSLADIEDHDYELVGECRLGSFTIRTLKCIKCGHVSDGWWRTEREGL